MGRHRSNEQMPDLFSTEGVGGSSSNQASDVTTARPSRRSILPKGLAKGIKYLDDQEFDRLLRVTTEEARRRGKLPASVAGSEARMKKRPLIDRPTQIAAVPLSQGRVNAVRAAFKAGVTPSRIARQFGLSQADVRKALASLELKR
jgi:hypothetical protein